MTAFNIMLAPGDGIGPEVTAQAVKVLHKVSDRFGHRFQFTEEPVGGVAIERYGTALREEALRRAKGSDAILFGAVGDPRYDDPTGTVRPEQALLKLRGGLGLFANLRPVRISESTIDASPLKPEKVAGTDFIVIRELTGGIYFGRPQRRWLSEDGRAAVDTMHYTEPEVQRIMHVAFRFASQRRKRVTSVDKANVLDTSRLWREIAEETAAQYPDITLEHVLVDACAMHIVNQPTRFDVIVTTNMFGDILTDEAAVIAGSLGMMPSACLGDLREDGTGFGLYEPIHGSAPDIAGQGRANPVGMILSTAMMLRHSLGLSREAETVESAVALALADGCRTADIATDTQGLTTWQMGDAVASRI
ncbi:MAG: 3-isopropylmalate dehydrogenase [Myxococcota bacterium]|nr:3-isopropylmalate dehydrogenase [Myxococcota bacterium]